MTRLPLALLAILWALPATAEPVQVFVEDVKVELDGWDARQAEALGKALAADLQGVIVRNPAYAPMTYENLESQLRKEKRAEQLSCSKRDQSCIQKILDNYGCEERLYGTVRQVGEQAQVTLTRYRNEQLVPGGASSAYSSVDASRIADVAKRLATDLFGDRATTAGSLGALEEKRLGGQRNAWSPSLEAGVVIEFSSEPPGALVEVDGLALCETPCSRELSKREHSVSLRKARYAAWQGFIDPESTSSVDETLSPMFGRLSARSIPSGLRVSLNGKPWGTTPIEARELDPGVYDVLVVDEQYEESGQRVVLEIGENRMVDLTPTPREGALKVSVCDSTGNAVVSNLFVDGERVGSTPWADRVRVGLHRLRVVTADGRSAERTVTVYSQTESTETLEVVDLVSEPTRVRLQAGAAEPTVLSEALWRDPSTGLHWQRVSDQEYPWQGAAQYCESNAAGLPGARWRLPTSAELESILSTRRLDGCLLPDDLQGRCGWTWSSSSHPEFNALALAVDFRDGGRDTIGKSNANGVRCVRTGPTPVASTTVRDDVPVRSLASSASPFASSSVAKPPSWHPSRFDALGLSWLILTGLSADLARYRFGDKLYNMQFQVIKAGIHSAYLGRYDKKIGYFVGAAGFGFYGQYGDNDSNEIGFMLYLASGGKFETIVSLFIVEIYYRKYFDNYTCIDIGAQSPGLWFTDDGKWYNQIPPVFVHFGYHWQTKL